jgi:hypothetical protein
VKDLPQDSPAEAWACRHCKKTHPRGQKYCDNKQGANYVPTAGDGTPSLTRPPELSAPKKV